MWIGRSRFPFPDLRFRQSPSGVERHHNTRTTIRETGTANLARPNPASRQHFATGSVSAMPPEPVAAKLVRDAHQGRGRGQVQ